MLWAEFHVPLSIVDDVKAPPIHHAQGGGRPGALAPLLDQPGVILHGSLDESKLVPLQARTIAVLHPSDVGLPGAEHHALPVLEASAAGCVPILLPVTANADAWIAAIRAIRDDPTGAVRAARAFATARPWADFVDHWDDLLQDVVRQNSASHRPPSQRWVVVSVGLGHGEAALARAVLDVGAARGHRMEVYTNHASHVPVLRGDWPVIVDPSLQAALAAAASSPDCVLLSSAAMCAGVLAMLPHVAPNVPVASLEHNWPEGLERLPGASLLQRVLFAVPPSAFLAGVSIPAPVFRVDGGISDKLTAVGWLPPVQPRPSTPDRKRVLLYFGVWADPATHALLADLAIVLERLRERMGVKGVYIGGEADGNAAFLMPSWLDHHRVLDPAGFAAELDRADLVLCHPGAGTIGGARARGIPVVVFAPGRVFDHEPGCPGDRFAYALFMAGEVELILADPPPTSIEWLLLRLLDEAPPSPSGGGAERAADLIETMIANPVSVAWRPPVLRQ